MNVSNMSTLNNNNNNNNNNNRIYFMSIINVKNSKIAN